MLTPNDPVVEQLSDADTAPHMKQFLIRAAPTMPLDMLLMNIMAWQRATFKDYTPQSSLAHLIKETEELQREPYDMEEWADALFLVLQGADRVFQLYAGDSILDALRKKFVKNLQREWEAPDAEGVILHKKENET